MRRPWLGGPRARRPPDILGTRCPRACISSRTVPDASLARIRTRVPGTRRPVSARDVPGRERSNKAAAVVRVSAAVETFRSRPKRTPRYPHASTVAVRVFLGFYYYCFISLFATRQFCFCARRTRLGIVVRYVCSSQTYLLGVKTKKKPLGHTSFSKYIGKLSKEKKNYVLFSFVNYTIL